SAAAPAGAHRITYPDRWGRAADGAGSHADRQEGQGGTHASRAAARDRRFVRNSGLLRAGPAAYARWLLQGRGWVGPWMQPRRLRTPSRPTRHTTTSPAGAAIRSPNRSFAGNSSATATASSIQTPFGAWSTRRRCSSITRAISTGRESLTRSR